MNFNNINGVWRQIKAYIDDKFSSISSSTFNTLRNGVYYYTKQGTYITPNQYQDSIKPNILGIAVYWDGYSFLVGGSYKSDIKYGNIYNAEAVKVYCPSSNLEVGSKIQESVDSIVDMTNILYKDSVAYLKKMGEVSGSIQDYTYVLANVIKKSIDDTKANNKASGTVVMATSGMNLLMEHFKTQITEMFKRIGIDWNLLLTRSKRDGTASILMTSDFVVVNQYEEGFYEVNNLTNEVDLGTGWKFSPYDTYPMPLDIFYSKIPPIYDISRNAECVYSVNAYAYCNTAILIN